MKKKQSKNPIIYIGGPGWSFDQFEPLIDKVGVHFEEIIKCLDIRRPDGRRININLFVEGSSPEKIRAYAKRISDEDSLYEIRMSAGLSYHIWLASRLFEIEYEFSPG